MNSEREKIERQIYALLKEINIELSFGSPEKANQLRNRISILESEKQKLRAEHDSPQSDGGSR